MKNFKLILCGSLWSLFASTSVHAESSKEPAAAGTTGKIEITESAEPAATEKVSGVVRVVGSAYNSKVVISGTGDNSGQTSFCRGAQTKKVGRLSGMTISVNGSWVEKKRRKSKKIKRCFSIANFTIEKASSGRKPLVGTLNHSDANYSVETADGKKHSLERVTKGLKGLVGKKVIIDVKPLSGSKGDQSWKVVSYSAYP